MGFVAVFVSILVSFFVGAGVLLLVAGRLLLNYLIVKASRGRKVLLFVDTPFGRRTSVGKIEGDVTEGTISWDYHGSKKLTEIKGRNAGVDVVEDDGSKLHFDASNVGRFFGVFFVALNVEAPFKPYNLSVLGEIPHSVIDLVTFQNLLDRSMTRPSLDNDQLFKLVRMTLILVVILGLLLVVLFIKVGGIATAVQSLSVI